MKFGDVIKVGKIKTFAKFGINRMCRKKNINITVNVISENTLCC